MGSYVDPWDRVCLVPGCGLDLSGLSKYHHRHRVCQQHLKAASVVLADGDERRFCQQCGRFQPVSEFNGARRSCQAGLHAHNARRRNCYLEPEDAPPEQAQPSKKARSQVYAAAAGASPTVVDAATVDPQLRQGLEEDLASPAEEDLASPAEEDLASEDVDAFLDGALQRLFNTQPDMVLAVCSAE